MNEGVSKSEGYYPPGLMKSLDGLRAQLLGRVTLLDDLMWGGRRFISVSDVYFRNFELIIKLAWAERDGYAPVTYEHKYIYPKVEVSYDKFLELMRFSVDSDRDSAVDIDRDSGAEIISLRKDGFAAVKKVCSG